MGISNMMAGQHGIHMAFEKISWVNRNNTVLSVDMGDREDAFGEIDEMCEDGIHTGFIEFPDDRRYDMWYYPQEGKLHFDEERGGNCWTASARIHERFSNIALEDGVLTVNMSTGDRPEASG